MATSSLDLRRQLDRMLRSRMFLTRPRSAELLQFFVDHSTRHGFLPINQHLLATHALGFETTFDAARSAQVRVKVGRLRETLERYYKGPGRHDRVMLQITPGPYRLEVRVREEAADDGDADRELRALRHQRPKLLAIEPEVGGGGAHDGFAVDLILQLLSLTAEDHRITVSGPLSGDRLEALGVDSVQRLAADLGYDFVLTTHIRNDEARLTVRMIVTDTVNGHVATDATSAFAASNEARADEVATWIYNRLSATFATHA